MKEITFGAHAGKTAWLAWRKKGIGASDASVITGSSPYKSIFSLWKEKCEDSESTFVSDAMKHGIENEAHVRDIYSLKRGCTFEPIYVESDDFSHIKASLDGYDRESKLLIEIKCPVSEKTLDLAKEGKPPHVYWEEQVQWQLMISESAVGFLLIWDHRTDEVYEHVITKNPDLQQLMLKKANKFWESVVKKTPPEGFEKIVSKESLPEVHDQGLAHLFSKYLNIDEKLKAVTKEKKEIREKLLSLGVSLGSEDGFMSDGFYVSRTLPRATHCLDDMRRDGIDVDKYKRRSDYGPYKITLLGRPKSKA